MEGGTTELTERERDILDFEALWWRQPGAKEQEIRRRFDISATRYYQLVNALLDRPEALTYAPATVNRLRRLREARAAVRGGRAPRAAGPRTRAGSPAS